MAACFEVDEYYYDAQLLRRTCRDLLRRLGVHVKTGWAAGAQAVAAAHDVVVAAAYAGLNEVLTGLGCAPVELQYEGCEVAIVEAPRLDGLNLVVMDGPFCSVAPYHGGRYLLYDVVHSVHARATGYANTGIRPVATAFTPMLTSARRFVGPLEGARHVQSLIAQRVVLPGVDATDARPSQVWWAGDRVLAVLSGKVSTAVAAGREAAAQVAGKLALAVA